MGKKVIYSIFFKPSFHMTSFVQRCWMSRKCMNSRKILLLTEFDRILTGNEKTESIPVSFEIITTNFLKNTETKITRRWIKYWCKASKLYVLKNPYS